MRVEPLQAKTSPVYEDSFEHIAAELHKLDLLIQLRVMLLRLETQAAQRAQPSGQSYISHEEVDWLLGQNDQRPDELSEIRLLRQQVDTLQSEINRRVSASLQADTFLALPQLGHFFSLSPFEVQVLIICLAPELDRKYDKLYAYLQDDVTRKKPSVDLILDLLCETKIERWQARSLFSEQGMLFQARLIDTTDDPQSPSGSSGLARFLQLDQRILNYLLGNNYLDSRLQGMAKLFNSLNDLDAVLVEPTIKTKLLHLIRHYFADQQTVPKKLTLYFHGPYGVGKRDLALGICGQLNCQLLYLDLSLLLAHDADPETALRLAFRDGLILQAALYFDKLDLIRQESDKAQFVLKKLAVLMAEYGWLVFLAGDRPWVPQGVFDQTVFQALEIPVADVPMREIAWQRALDQIGVESERTWTRQLAGQFRLTPGQIWDVVQVAQNACTMAEDQSSLSLTELYAACRDHSNQNLGDLALKITSRYGWTDIILPEDTLILLKEICSQVQYRYRVFGEWGFDQKLAHGKGLSVLFSGPPGTGKTMAAEVIARELKLDLYKIDLSGVVSKYIGETEKNLAKIFHEAETSNAILFFDEADALFGKRTEVSDAHDRYANIETSYLLQKMEEYEGVVILATNLRENMDEAFTRRIRFVVEFPFPDAVSRREIWRTHFPREAPVSEEIDCEFLAKQFQIAGGNIKNIVLNAAFLAAKNGQVIEMEHLLHGTKREYEKMGKLWDDQSVIMSKR